MDEIDAQTMIGLAEIVMSLQSENAALKTVVAKFTAYNKQSTLCQHEYIQLPGTFLVDGFKCKKCGYEMTEW